MAGLMAERAGAPLSSIRFVIPYFGQWPFWMPFFLKSCEANSTIDWLLITDCGVPEAIPANVRVVETLFADYCAHVSAQLGIHFQPAAPYKLCDLKPALGQVHERELEGYDFWAFGDIDVVYGDLREHFSEARLARRDLFSTHSRRVSGHLCVLRNIPLMREAFTHVPGWRGLLENPEHVTFDESAFSRLFMRRKNWPEEVRDLLSKLSFWGRRAEFEETHSTYTLMPDRSQKVPDYWYWRNGRLTNNLMGERSLPYLHFLRWKSDDWQGLSPQMLLGPPDLVNQSAWKISAQGWRPLADSVQ